MGHRPHRARSSRTDPVGDEGDDGLTAVPRTSELDRLLADIDEAASDGWLGIGEVLDKLGPRGFGPLLIVFSVLILLPTGLLPGMPAAMGAIYLLLGGQLLLGRRSPWLPARLRRVEIAEARVVAVLERVRPTVRRLGRIVRPRAQALVDGWLALRVAALICCLAGSVIIPIGFIPGLPFVLSLPVLAYGIGLTARDGLAMAAGHALFLPGLIFLAH